MLREYGCESARYAACREGSTAGALPLMPRRKIALVIIEVLDDKNWSKVTTCGLVFSNGNVFRPGDDCTALEVTLHG